MKTIVPFTSKYEQPFTFHNYTQAYSKYCDDGVIDLDKRLKSQPDFQVYRLEEIVNCVNGILPPSRQTPYWITLVKKGSGEKRIGQYTFSIDDFNVFVVSPRTVHSSKYWSKDCSGYVLSFTIDFLLNSAFSKQCIFNRKILKSTNHPFLRLNKDQVNSTTRIFEDLLRISACEKSGGKDMLAVKVLELLIHCDSFFETPDTDNDLPQQHHPVVEKFTELLNKKYNLQRGVQYYADALNVHPNYLNFLLKKHVGISAKESIDSRLIMESKYLLINPFLRVKEVAHQLGFDDPNNFSTFFQKHAGSSPLMYRSSVL